MMGNEQKKEKKHRFLFLKIFGSILLFFCMLLFIAILIPQLVRMGLHASPFQVLDGMGFYKSASRFDAAVGEKKRGVPEKWIIEKKADKDDGAVYLYIKTVGENEEEKDYLDFYLYDSGRIAKKKYNKIREDMADYIVEEDRYWFIFQEPGVMDARIKRMYYRDGSLLIGADVEVLSDWPEPVEPDPDEKENSQTDHFNRWELKDYILLHAEEDHLYLIHVLLPLTEGYVPGS